MYIDVFDKFTNPLHVFFKDMPIDSAYHLKAVLDKPKSALEEAALWKVFEIWMRRSPTLSTFLEELETTHSYALFPHIKLIGLDGPLGYHREGRIQVGFDTDFVSTLDSLLRQLAILKHIEIQNDAMCNS